VRGGRNVHVGNGAIGRVIDSLSERLGGLEIAGLRQRFDDPEEGKLAVISRGDCCCHLLCSFDVACPDQRLDENR